MGKFVKIMAKEKKIGVNFFANDRVKPKSISWENEMVTAYPLYCSVTYNQENTQFRVLINGQAVMVTPDLAQIKPNSHLENDLKELEALIVKIIRTVVHYNPDFTVRNINARLHQYTKSLASYLIGANMSSYIGPIIQHSYEQRVIDTIIFGLKVILEEYSEMTVLDWLAGGFSELKNKVENNEKIDSELLIDLIHNVLLLESTVYIDATDSIPSNSIEPL
jgi:hypothetical protein